MIQISFLIVSNAVRCTSDRLNSFFFFIISLNGVDMDARFGKNLLAWLIEPISDLRSLMQFVSLLGYKINQI